MYTVYICYILLCKCCLFARLILPDPATTSTDTEPFCPGLYSDPCLKIPNNRKINTVINTTAVRMTPLTTTYNNAISFQTKRYQ